MGKCVGKMFLPAAAVEAGAEPAAAVEARADTLALPPAAAEAGPVDAGDVELAGALVPPQAASNAGRPRPAAPATRRKVRRSRLVDCSETFISDDSCA